ncbi:MAG TPA: CpaF family protein [Alphaproteobacteria bacterium]|jgi:pilus assembly protein CpaF|nr:CpaF family protein [Alphaproteobacteria bacterium]
MTFGRRNLGQIPPLGASPRGAAAPPGGDVSSPPQAGGSPPIANEEADVIVGRERLNAIVRQRIPNGEVRELRRGELAGKILAIVREQTQEAGITLDPVYERNLVTFLIEAALATAKPAPVVPLFAVADDAPTATPAPNRIEAAKDVIQPKLIERLDLSAASNMPRTQLARELTALVSELVQEEKLQLNGLEQRDLVTSLLNDMLGFGPLEELLADEKVTDIMVNGPHQVYVEKGGKLVLSHVRLRDDAHVMNIASRIVSKVGRRIDESNPLCDARLPDGSRVNIIIPPLAIDGPSMSIRKFSKRRITLDIMAQQGNMSQAMATLLKIAGRSQLNIVISGGTGSGKTTLLNAISQLIDPGERIVTIEDAAELQLQQPHVVRLETRPASIEGSGEISMRDLVKNALRMRPDRIILGEVRGSEAVDMLQAMNTGHEGSLGTIHANRPREALTRLENMIGMSGINLPSRATRTQISSALDMIVQVSRMRDGVRRITNITEVVGMEGDVITTQELFTFQVEGEGQDGRLIGKFISSGLRPAFAPKAAYFGLEKPLFECMT